MTGIDDLVYVRRSLRTLLKWKHLGLYLELKNAQLLTIEKEQRGDVDYCIMEMLVCWLCSTPSASWSTLKAALMNIGQHQLADTISADGKLKWLSGRLHTYIVDPLRVWCSH